MKVRTLGESIDDLLESIQRTTECTVSEAVEIMKNRADRYMERKRLEFEEVSDE